MTMLSGPSGYPSAKYVALTLMLHIMSGSEISYLLRKQFSAAPKM